MGIRLSYWLEKCVYITEEDMRAEEFIVENEVLDEGASSVLYHYTNTNAALQILTDGAFGLSSTVGNKSEAQYAPEGYPYFLSASRSRVGDYHRYVGTSGVMFVLDGNWFGQRYPVKPIDYWERGWQHAPDRTRETEDRIFSKEPTIPIGGVRGIHVLIKEKHEFRSPVTRKLIILAKKMGIKTFLYNDEQAWRLQDTRRAVTVKQSEEFLKGQEPSRITRAPYRVLYPWVELIYKKSKAELSEKASKLLYNIKYYAGPNEDNNLGVDLSNERKPGSGDYDTAIKIITYMQKNGFATPLDLKKSIAEKWKNIS